MTTGGWIFMLLSISFTLVLASWCYYRVLTAPAVEDEPEPGPAPGHDGDPRTLD